LAITLPTVSSAPDAAVRRGETKSGNVSGVRFGRAVPLALVALLLAVPASAYASQVTKQTDSDDGNCTIANCSLRDAVKYGPSNDVISVPAGTYHLSPALGEIVIEHGLTINGAARGPTIVTADGGHRVFEIPNAGAPGPVTFRRLEVTGGNGEQTGIGGGIYAHSTQLLTLDHARVRGNNADYTNFTTSPASELGGGGVYSDGPLTVTDSTIDHNTITMHQGGRLLASGGAGVYALGGALTLTRTEVRDNQVSLSAAEAASSEVEKNGGGGIYALALPSATLDASTMAGNSVTVFGGDPNPHESGGGGIYALFGDLTATNSTLAGNTVDVFAPTLPDSGGGGLYTNQAGATLLDATIARNTATNSAYNAGGGLYRYGGSVTARNTIFALNVADFSANCLGDVSSQGHNLDSGNDCGLTGPGDKIKTKPLLGTLGSHGGPTRTELLLKGSPAINGAGLTGCPAMDQRGHSRPRGPACDIGAVEADVPNAATAKAKGIKSKKAKLRGTVNPNGVATTYRFEFGKTNAYGKKTKLTSAGAGTLPLAVSIAVSKLKPGTTYHYRVVAINAFGTTFGLDRKLKTKK
jgi:CSLREA domain-containing protein